MVNRMKTLGEVIKALEKCMADDAIESEGVYLATDALHYLKDYRMLVADFAAKQKELEDAKDRYQEIEDEYEELKDWWAEEYAENVPLTWDELQSMKGKPVWIEQEDQVDAGKTYKGWVVIRDILEYAIVTEPRLFSYKGYGETWKAYRHERN